MKTPAHRLEERIYRLRGEPKPRYRDEAEKSVGITETVGIYSEISYAFPPIKRPA